MVSLIAICVLRLGRAPLSECFVTHARRNLEPTMPERWQREEAQILPPWKTSAAGGNFVLLSEADDGEKQWKASSSPKLMDLWQSGRWSEIDRSKSQ